MNCVPEPRSDIKIFLESLDNESYTRAFKEIHEIVSHSKERDDEYLRRHQNKVRAFVQDNLILYETAANDWTATVLGELRSALVHMPSLPNTDKAQTELYDKVEGSIVAQLSEYRARLKKSKTKVNGAMIDADRRMHDAYETHKASDNEALLNAFLKLKDEEDSDKAHMANRRLEIERSNDMEEDLLEDGGLGNSCENSAPEEQSIA